MKITISVTADDIERGIAGNCHACPVARAIARALGIPFARIGLIDMSLSDGQGNHAKIGTPAVAARFMENFDTCEPVEPFEFELDVPGELVPAGAS